ncbi:hypothetical protein KJ780_03460 [Candidatus Micrarchaeota archaeon]|nr:hypothetical protein [Candidatus Micrarchaeota archaeon]
MAGSDAYHYYSDGKLVSGSLMTLATTVSLIGDLALIVPIFGVGVKAQTTIATQATKSLARKGATGAITHGRSAWFAIRSMPTALKKASWESAKSVFSHTGTKLKGIGKKAGERLFPTTRRSLDIRKQVANRELSEKIAANTNLVSSVLVDAGLDTIYYGWKIIGAPFRGASRIGRAIKTELVNEYTRRSGMTVAKKTGAEAAETAVEKAPKVVKPERIDYPIIPGVVTNIASKIIGRRLKRKAVNTSLKEDYSSSKESIEPPSNAELQFTKRYGELMKQLSSYKYTKTKIKVEGNSKDVDQFLILLLPYIEEPNNLKKYIEAHVTDAGQRGILLFAIDKDIKALNGNPS